MKTYSQVNVVHNDDLSSSIIKVLERPPYQQYLEFRKLLSHLGESDLIEVPHDTGSYLLAKDYILSKMKVLYETDVKSRAYKESFAEEESKRIRNNDYQLNDSEQKKIYEELPTQNGRSLFVNLSEKAFQEKKYKEALVFIRYLKSFSIEPSQTSDGKVNYIETLLMRALHLNETLPHNRSLSEQQTDICEAFSTNPFPVLKDNFITLTSLPVTWLDSTFVVGKDVEENLFIFELVKAKHDWIIQNKRNLAKNGEGWINFGRSYCPQKLEVTKSYHLSLLNESMRVFYDPFSHAVLQINDFSLRPDDKQLLSSFLFTAEHILKDAKTDEYSPIYEKAMTAYVRVGRMLRTEESKQNFRKQLYLLFETHPVAQVRSLALTALTGTGEEALDLFKNDLQEPAKKMQILHAMKRIYLSVPGVPKTLETLLSSKDSVIRQEIVRMLGDTPRDKGLIKEAIPLLFSIIEKDSAPVVKIEALKSLRGLKFSDVITPFLITFLKDPSLSDELLIEGIETLGSKYDLHALPVLIDFLSHQNETIRKKTTYMLTTAHRCIRGSGLSSLLIKTISEFLDMDTEKNDSKQKEELRTLTLLVFKAIDTIVSFHYLWIEEQFRELLPAILKSHDTDIIKTVVTMIDQRFSPQTIVALIEIYPQLFENESKKILKAHILDLKQKKILPEHLLKIDSLNLVQARE